MEDEFELISKSELKKLRENISTYKKNENLKPKQNITPKTSEQNPNSNIQKQNITLDNNTINQIIKAIQKENNTDKQLILKELTHIKDLNKTTLSNLLDKTSKLDTRIGNLVDTISELVKTITDLIETNSNNSPNKELHELLDKITTMNIQNTPNNQNNKEILTKITEIEKFMNNLKILLGQIKPSNIQTTQNSIPINNNLNQPLPPL